MIRRPHPCHRPPKQAELARFLTKTSVGDVIKMHGFIVFPYVSLIWLLASHKVWRCIGHNVCRYERSLQVYKKRYRQDMLEGKFEQMGKNVVHLFEERNK